MYKNTQTQYGSITKLFHWTMALLVLMQYFFVYWKQYVLEPNTDIARYFIANLHKPFGVLILFLVAFRIAWRFVNERVQPEPSLPAWEVKAAVSAHMLLYAFMVLMPIGGILMSNAAGYPVNFFGLFDLPTFIEKNKTIGGFLYKGHVYASYVALVVVILHIGGAFRNHLVLKNNTLKRMLPFN